MKKTTHKLHRSNSFPVGHLPCLTSPMGLAPKNIASLQSYHLTATHIHSSCSVCWAGSRSVTSLEHLFVLGKEFAYSSDTARAQALKHTDVYYPGSNAMHVTGTANTFHLGKPACKPLRGTRGRVNNTHLTPPSCPAEGLKAGKAGLGFTQTSTQASSSTPKTADKSLSSDRTRSAFACFSPFSSHFDFLLLFSWLLFLCTVITLQRN